MAGGQDAEAGGGLNELAQMLSSWSIPLYQTEGGRPSQIGTCFFVVGATGVYLVTAAHVLARGGPKEIYYYVTPRETTALQGERYMHRDSSVDVGILRLRGSVLPPFLAVDKYPVPRELLLPKLTPRWDRHYMVLGFPSSKNRSNPAARAVSAQLYAYRADSIPEAHYKSSGVNAETHLALPLDRKVAFNELGEPLHFPLPHGMSGSPVWVVPRESDTDESKVAFGLVGVAIEYHEKTSTLIATDISAAMNVLL